MLLKTTALTKHFGGLAAVSQFDMFINKGEIVGLIGPNGAGKTTIINLISGFLKSSSGNIIFDEEDITSKPAHIMARMGIGRTFQITPMFFEFSTFKNIVASHYLAAESCFWGAIFNTSKYRNKEEHIVKLAEETLEFVGLSKARNELAKNLPHGYQKLLDLARALAIKPKLLLLDEPIGGISSDEINLVLKAIDKVRSQGTTILLVEHNMEVVMSICDRIIVANYGQKIAEGTPDEVRRDKDVISAYFGGEYHA
ncbi:MAG: ABC transporter ATP-binding protein [Clostridia bacterium]|jgi:branched-chain amino acid transport system ATP-binding protein|nr:ABC transporter ATP-binding protein [Clostridia bacterium]